MAARAFEPQDGGREGPLWLLLHELDDPSAEPLRRCLAPAALAAGGQLLSVPAPALLQARRWSLRLDADGRTETLLQLGSHRIAGLRLRAVLNRLAPPQLTGVHADAAYQQQEWQAILAFWLASLPCPVHNGADPIGLSGPVASASWWRLQAGQAGLPSLSKGGAQATGPGLRLLILGQQCLPAPETRAAADPALQPWLQALPAFASRLGLTLLEVRLRLVGPHAWALDRADPRPDLRHLDAALQAALLEALGLGPVRPGLLPARDRTRPAVPPLPRHAPEIRS